MMWLNDLLALTTVLALMSVSAFIVLYARMPWTTTALGRTIMGAAVSVGLLSLVGTLRRVDQLWLDADLTNWLTVGSIVAYLAVTVAWLAKARVVLQGQRRREDDT